MAPAIYDDTADLPIARQFTVRRPHNKDEKALDPNDSISVRQVAKSPSIPSFDSTLRRTEKAQARCVELESQTSVDNVRLKKSESASQVSSVPRKPSSWLSRLHPSEQTIEDAVMGTSDGMTVPFALTASLAGIAPNARYVMLAGLAEMTAGALSMALGGALQARCEKEAYDSTMRQTSERVRNSPQYIFTVVEDAFSQWNLSPASIASITRDLSNTSTDEQIDFAMRFHHQLTPPDTSRYFKSATTLGFSYFMAGLLGLFPYMVVKRTQTKEALYAAIAIEAVALYVFGYCKTGINIGWKGKENMLKAFWGAASMVIVGAVASGLAVGLIILVNSKEHVSG